MFFVSLASPKILRLGKSTGNSVAAAKMTVESKITAYRANKKFRIFGSG